MPDTLSSTATRFHISLNVSDLGRAISFYRVLFGIEPAKVHDDYAKFDVLNPPVVFSLAPCAPAAGWSISHLGLRVADTDAIRVIQQRLVTSGVETQCEEGVVCGYAKQSKCWVRDPDNNFWEIYVIEKDMEPLAPTMNVSPVVPLHEAQTIPAPPSSLVWEHRVTQDIPTRIPYSDEALDEVRLEGTFNGPFDGNQRIQLLHEARRVLKPGGRITLHALAADRPLPGTFPSLPGIAAFVKQLPLESDLPDALRELGFHSLHFATFAESAAFMHDGVELREMKITGWKSGTPGQAANRHVMYRGPFQQARSEGHIFPRGCRVTVCADTYELLQHGPLADEFLFLDSDPIDNALTGVTCSVR